MRYVNIYMQTWKVMERYQEPITQLKSRYGASFFKRFLEQTNLTLEEAIKKARGYREVDATTKVQYFCSGFGCGSSERSVPYDIVKIEIDHEGIIYRSENEVVSEIITRIPSWIETPEVRDMARFKRDGEAFPRIKNELLERGMYLEKFVAIYEGQIIDHDTDIVKLAERVYGQYGYIPIYMDKVTRKKEIWEFPSPEG